MSSAQTAVIGNTTERTRAPPIRSERTPPRGRQAVASAMKPAVRNPASTFPRWNCSVRRTGSESAIATNPPKVRK